MQASDPELETRLNEAMQAWVDQGSLPPDKSCQLDALVYQMSHRGRHTRMIAVLRGAVAALAAYVSMLFFACPAAGSVFPACETIIGDRVQPLTVQAEGLANGSVIILSSLNEACYYDWKGARA